MRNKEIFQFGEFHVEALARVLRREEEILALNRRAFDVLLYLVQNSGRILTHDELLKNVWPDTYVDENSLAQSISALRRALGEKPGDNSYIITLPGRGYQFVAPVTVVAAEGLSTIPDAAIAARDAPNRLLFQQDTIRTRVIIEEKEQLGPPVLRRSWAMIGTAALLLAVLAIAVIGYVVQRRSARRLTVKALWVLA